MADDRVFESTAPPEGERQEGQAAVPACGEALFSRNPARPVRDRGAGGDGGLGGRALDPSLAERRRWPRARPRGRRVPRPGRQGRPEVVLREGTARCGHRRRCWPVGCCRERGSCGSPSCSTGWVLGSRSVLLKHPGRTSGRRRHVVVGCVLRPAVDRMGRATSRASRPDDPDPSAGSTCDATATTPRPTPVRGLRMSSCPARSLPTSPPGSCASCPGPPRSPAGPSPGSSSHAPAQPPERRQATGVDDERVTTRPRPDVGPRSSGTRPPMGGADRAEVPVEQARPSSVAARTAAGSAAAIRRAASATGGRDAGF
jgi:hypothetical protein